jgi:hypothetical protein
MDLGTQFAEIGAAFNVRNLTVYVGDPAFYVRYPTFNV